MMTAEQHEAEVVKLVRGMNDKQLEDFIHGVIHFSCVPHKGDYANWCSMCESCWHRYCEWIIERNNK